MKRIFSIIVLLIASILLPVIGLSCSSGPITASLGEEFTLPVGQTVEINNESLTIKFIEVTADSRCATGVQCIWAGEAKCLMLIQYYQSVSSLEFTQSGGSITQEAFNQYMISFRLEPYPEAGKEINNADYKLVMTVTK